MSCFPKQYINFNLDLNFPSYNSLQHAGNWLYIDIDGSGTKGVIIYNKGTEFKIYDRNAPHLCPDENTTLEVIRDSSGFNKIHCKKDNSEWLLETGEPLKNTQVPPKTYRYTFENNILTVYN
ncbi:hypothetical protein DBX24_00155 [Bergeyella cardium]|uniref:Rieske domain-containing protein n=1 Tax=Bergeyella cardium TaxID=1585976 RepID=A0A6P1QVN6_9FLAO|nr:hypothetical protein DBX24_00155 [Bergeyella cardium]